MAEAHIKEAVAVVFKHNLKRKKQGVVYADL